MAVTNIEAGVVRASPECTLVLDAGVDTPGIFTENISLVEVQPWLPLGGLPDQIGDYYAHAYTVGSDIRPVLLPGHLNPDILDSLLDADARFVPKSTQVKTGTRGSSTGHPAGTTKTWLPNGHATTESGPFDHYMDLESYNAVDNIAYNASTSPVPDDEFNYFGQDELTRPIMDFASGHALATLHTPSTGQQTFMVMFIPRPSVWTPAVVMDAYVNQNSDQHSLQLTWNQGRVAIRRDGVEWLAHESVAPAGSPILAAISLSPAEIVGTGLVMIDDGVQTTREIEYVFASIDPKHLTAIFGGHRLVSSFADGHWAFTQMAAFELLEVAYWGREMDESELRTKAALLAAAYGIAP